MTKISGGITLGITLILHVLVSNLVNGTGKQPDATDCVDDVAFPDMNNCTRYYQCFDSSGDGDWVITSLGCPPGGYFEPVGASCVHGPCGSTPHPPPNCVESNPYVDPDDCTKYYQCFDLGENWEILHLDCPPGGYFDPLIASCIVGNCSNNPIHPDCKDSRPYPDQNDCTSYFQCFHLDGEWIPEHLTCPPGGYYDPSEQACISGACTITGTTTKMVPSAPPKVIIRCNQEGPFAFPGSCTRYYNCALIPGDTGSFKNYIFECPPGSYFSDADKKCTNGECPYA